MTKFAGATCKTEITIAYGSDFDFLEKMTDALRVSGSMASVVSTKQWSSTGQESMRDFVAIIVLHEAICRTQNNEEIGLGLIEEILGTLGGQDHILQTQKILLCAADNEFIIGSFSELHGISREVLEPDNLGICNWSIYRFNTFGKNPLRTRNNTFH